MKRPWDPFRRANPDAVDWRVAIARVAAGEPGAKEDLARLLAPHARGLATQSMRRYGRLLRPDVDEDDIQQETLAHAVDRLPSYTAQDEVSFLAWFKRVARNQISDIVARLKATKRGREVTTSMFGVDGIRNIDAPAPERSSATDHLDTLDVVLGAMESLDDDERSIAELVVFDDMSVAQAARKLRLPETTARRRYAHARTVLADALLQSSVERKAVGVRQSRVKSARSGSSSARSSQSSTGT